MILPCSITAVFDVEDADDSLVIFLDVANLGVRRGRAVERVDGVPRVGVEIARGRLGVRRDDGRRKTGGEERERGE